GLVNGDTVTGVALASAGAAPAATVAGSPYAITASQASGTGLDNYTISYAAGQLTVSPAPLIITADNETLVQGGSLPALTVHYSGFVNGDSPASLTTAPTAMTVPATSPPGGYAINVSGAVDANYAITYVAGTLTIAPAKPVVTTPSQFKGHGGKASFKGHHFALSDANANASLRLSVTTSLGRLYVRAGGVKVKGNNTKALTLTGTAAALNK